LEIIACGLYAINYLHSVDKFETRMLLRWEKAGPGWAADIRSIDMFWLTSGDTVNDSF
jgi:hypothetical protein